MTTTPPTGLRALVERAPRGQREHLLLYARAAYALALEDAERALADDVANMDTASKMHAVRIVAALAERGTEGT